MRNAMLAFVVVTAVAGLAFAGDMIVADGGNIEITPINHASLSLMYNGKVIQVDPWSQGNYEGAPMADLILVTDIHGDHLDKEMIAKLRKPSAPVVGPAAVAEQVEGVTVMANGEKKEIAGVGIEAVPMYNLTRGPEEGKLFHDKGRGNGYLVTLGGKRLYIAGDTACTPEMKALENIDVAFVPMNLPYTMPPSEAAECVKTFKPSIVYPYHYRDSDLNEFSEALKDVPGVEVRIRNWYP